MTPTAALFTGAAGLEPSGLLATDKWHTTAEDLTEALVSSVRSS